MNAVPSAVSSSASEPVCSSNESAGEGLRRTLCQLRKGDVALVARVAPGTDPARQRLVELGFVQGERVKLIAAAPFGLDPIAVRIGTSTFALRRHEAALVELCAD